MESQDDASPVEPTATGDENGQDGRPIPKIGLVRDDTAAVGPVSDGSSLQKSAPVGSAPKDNVLLLKSRRSDGYLPLVTVCLAVLASLALLLLDFRLGAALLAASVGLALVFRVVLSDKQAGLLVVRSRVFDLWFLSALAAALALLAVIVPAPLN
jgi:hypothetical protein